MHSRLVLLIRILDSQQHECISMQFERRQQCRCRYWKLLQSSINNFMMYSNFSSNYLVFINNFICSQPTPIILAFHRHYSFPNGLNLFLSIRKIDKSRFFPQAYAPLTLTIFPLSILTTSSSKFVSESFSRE